jgi:hypothetical protein
VAYEVAPTRTSQRREESAGPAIGRGFLFNCLLRQVVWEADRRRSGI